MAATYQWSETNTVSVVVTDGISNINFGSVDACNINTTNYPINISTHSFIKYIRAKFSSSFTTISNMLFWKSAGNLLTGETIKAGLTTTFVTPVNTASGDSDCPTSAGSALAVLSAAGTATITSSPGYSEYIRLQLQTTGSAPSGNVNQKTFTFQYDEV